MFIALTAVPALLLGAAIWVFTETLPSCDVEILDRQTAPDQSFDLVVFSRDCGPSSSPNTQAALIPVGDELPDDAASFLSIGTRADLRARWDGFGNIELSVPEGAKIYRQDNDVAGVSVIYR